MVPSHIELSFNATSDNSLIFLSLVLRFLSLFYIKQFFCPFTLAVINSRSSLTEKNTGGRQFFTFSDRPFLTWFTARNTTTEDELATIIVFGDESPPHDPRSGGAHSEPFRRSATFFSSTGSDASQPLLLLLLLDFLTMRRNEASRRHKKGPLLRGRQFWK